MIEGDDDDDGDDDACVIVRLDARALTGAGVFFPTDSRPAPRGLDTRSLLEYPRLGNGSLIAHFSTGMRRKSSL